MPEVVLSLLKFALLGLVYLFLFRLMRALTTDVYGPRRKDRSAPPRPAIADSTSRRPRRAPSEIVVHPPDDQPDVVALDGTEVTLGRSNQMRITLRDVYASDEHASLTRDEHGWLVRDLGSTNGTYLNGAKVTQPTPFAAGDQIRIGKTRIEVRR